MLYDTIREATYEWGREFNAVSRGIVEKLIKADGGAGNAISEVTPPSVGNYAYVFDKEAHGIVVQHLDDDKYLIELDDGEQVELNKDIILLIAISPCVSVVLSVFLSAAFLLVFPQWFFKVVIRHIFYILFKVRQFYAFRINRINGSIEDQVGRNCRNSFSSHRKGH